MKAAPLNAAHLTMMVHVTKVRVQWASQTGSFWGFGNAFYMKQNMR